MPFKLFIFFAGSFFLLINQAFTQSSIDNQLISESIYPAFSIHDANFALIEDSSFYQRKAHWNTIIDEFYGAGDPLAAKQEIFNTYADRLQSSYPMFAGIDLDWDSLRTEYYNKITESTSRGQFTAIMAHFGYEFRELHTRIWDNILETTPPNPGTPIFYLNAFDMRHFGASLTTRDDGSLLVVRVVSEHPLGLQPGDLILGYEGIPWSELSYELFAAGIPLAGWYGSTDESINYMMLTNAGMNWHMFSTIDIVKHSGDTLHLSTDLLAGYFASEAIFNNPQIPIDGVSEPNFNPLDQFGGVSSGIIDNTNIGYIYVTKHNYEAVNPEFATAVANMLETDALIIDLRWNTGGHVALFEGMSLLFDFNFRPLQILFRCSEEDLFTLCPSNFPFWFEWDQTDTNSRYDKPIAVLTGPNSQSFGDIFAHTMEFHPRSRFFGRPTNGAFAGQITDNALTIDGWRVTASDFTMSDSSTSVISRARRATPVDEQVWLTQEDVANGEDTVVKRAIEWINIVNSITEKDNTPYPSGYALRQNYPNPFNPQTVINYQLAMNGNVELVIHNVLGKEITTLVSEAQNEGEYSVSFDASDLASGVYFYVLKSDDYVSYKKMILLK